MSATVTAMPGLSPERIKELEGQGINVSETVTDWTEFDLPEPQYGETIIGDLTEEEARIFATYYRLSQEIEDMSRTAMGDMLTRVGTQIRTSDRQKDLREAIKDGDLHFGTEEEEKKFCRAQQQVGYLAAMLFFNIGERTNNHDWRIGIRTKGRAVKTAKRLEAPIMVGGVPG